MKLSHCCHLQGQPPRAKCALGGHVTRPVCLQGDRRALLRGNDFLPKSGAVACTKVRKRPAQCQVLALQTDAALANVAQEQALAAPTGLARYRFVVPEYVTSFGQCLRVVGSLPELGGWNPDQGPVMSWSEGHQWSLECSLPQRPFEFKIIVFEGHGLRWESGCNRVIQARDEDGDIPVEIVVWLTCHFNATTSTQMQLAVPRASIQDAYETGKAALEFLQRRKSKLGHDAEQAASPDERQSRTDEVARLSEAVVEQSSALHQLGDMLGLEEGGGGTRNGVHVWSSSSSSSSSGNDSVAASDADETQMLLLAIDSARVPRVLRRIAFVQPAASWSAAEEPAAAANGDGSTPDVIPLTEPDGAVTAAPAAVVASAAVTAVSPQGLTPGSTSTSSPSLFRRGELDCRAEELLGAAEELLLLQQHEQEGLQAGPSEAPVTTSPSASEWAVLAREAGHVAEALAALDSPVPSTGEAAVAAAAAPVEAGAEPAGVLSSTSPAHQHTTQQLLQMRGLASLGSALAAGSSNGSGSGVTAKEAAEDSAGVGAVLVVQEAAAAAAGVAGATAPEAAATTASAAGIEIAVDVAVAVLAAQGAAVEPALDPTDHRLHTSEVTIAAEAVAAASSPHTEAAPVHTETAAPAPAPPSPYPAADAEVHPFQRLAASLKDLFRFDGLLAAHGQPPADQPPAVAPAAATTGAPKVPVPQQRPELLAADAGVPSAQQAVMEAAGVAGPAPQAPAKAEPRPFNLRELLDGIFL